MTSYAEYWKREISKSIEFLFNKTEQKRWPAPSIIAVERNVILASFGVRKLFESGVISADKFHASIPLARYPKKLSDDRVVASMQAERLFDYSKVQKQEKRLSFVCNQLIHSHVLRVVLSADGEGRFVGVLFNSDKSRKDSIYFMGINDFIERLSPICNHYFGRTVFSVEPGGQLSAVKS